MSLPCPLLESGPKDRSLSQETFLAQSVTESNLENFAKKDLIVSIYHMSMNEILLSPQINYRFLPGSQARGD